MLSFVIVCGTVCAVATELQAASATDANSHRGAPVALGGDEARGA